MRKKLEDLEVALALVQVEKEKEFSLLREHIVVLETRFCEDALAAQAKITDLEATLATANVKSEKAIQDHLNIQNELSLVKIQAELDSKVLEVRISHSLEEAATQRCRAEDILKLNLDVRARLRRAKKQLHKYKEKGWSFYKQLTFASWARDLGFHVGYMGGIETFWAWVKKPENFSKVDKVFVEELLPLKGIAEDALSIEQEEMPNCKGIKRMGFKPHLIYDLEAQAVAWLSPRIERQADSDVDSTRSMNSSVESWDCVHDKDLNNQ